MAGEGNRRPARALVAALLGLSVAVELGIGGLQVAHRGAPGHGAASQHRSVVTRARPPVDRGAAKPLSPAGRGIAAQAVLDQMAAAVLARNPRAFAAEADPEQPSLRAAAARMIRNLAQVPIASWSYSVDPVPAAPLAADRAHDLAAPAWLANVTLHYALRGYDSRPAAHRLYVTLVQRSGRWYVAGYDDGGPTRRSAEDLWNFGPVVALAGARTLVLGHPGNRTALARIAAEGDRDVPAVSRFWGRAGWRQRVVIEVPATAAELRGLVGGADLSQFAAVATVEIDGSAASGAAAGDRIIVNPANFDELGALGRRVVLTHEITHVATRPVTGPLLPDWLIEGIADYVGFRRSGLSPRAVAPELAADVADGRVPAALPSDAAFAATAAHLPESYEEAWLACRLLATRYGEPALRAVYRAVGTSHLPNRRAALDSALERVVHLDLRQFTAAWRADVRAELS